MMIYFLTHPNVQIDASIPVTQWSLSPEGIERLKIGLNQSWMKSIDVIYSSTEKKAVETADLIGNSLNLLPVAWHELGENDRTSTGFLESVEFEKQADAFFANPTKSVRGWESAVDAQKRITTAVRKIIKLNTAKKNILIVSHGAVGTLLYCMAFGKKIDRLFDQPLNSGGNYFTFNVDDFMTCDIKETNSSSFENLQKRWLSIDNLTM